MPPSPAPTGAKSQKCLLLLFPMPHLTATRAQKPRFCARNARKQGFQTPKAHKNLDFVLEMPENEGSEGKKRTKMAILCSKSLKSRVLKAWAPTVYAEELPTLLEMAAAWPGADAQTQNKKQKRVTAKCHPRLFVV